MTRTVALLSAVVVLSGCYSWSKARPQTESIIETRPAQVRVTLTDGRKLTVRHPTARADSLLGDLVVDESDNLQSSRPIPFADIRSVSTREFSLGLTAFRVVIVPVVVYATLYAVVSLALSSWHPL